MFFSWANVEGHTADSGYPFDSESYEQTPGHELQTDLTSEYDAALSMLGDGWFVPGITECRELINSCDYAMEKIAGVACYVFTSRANGRKLVIPACGYIMASEHHNDGSLACFWTSHVAGANTAWFFRVSESMTADCTVNARRAGVPIRAVRDP